MSVAAQLGLDDPDKDLLAEARARWPLWCGRCPRLGVVDELLGLRGWIAAADKADVDDVLHELARLASPTGGDDVVAAGALAWVLLPGACVVAYRLANLTARIDEVVAAQLWLEVRGFAWQRRRKVAANVVMNVRRGVLRDLGNGSPKPPMSDAGMECCRLPLTWTASRTADDRCDQLSCGLSPARWSTARDAA